MFKELHDPTLQRDLLLVLFLLVVIILVTYRF